VRAALAPEDAAVSDRQWRAAVSLEELRVLIAERLT
jgi:hypothetical protein